MRDTRRVALASVFAALHAALYLVSFGLWRNWGIYLEPIEGAILGPKTGFTAASIGALVARMIKPDPFWMFGVIAEPVGVLAAALLAQSKWKPVLTLYIAALLAYFLHPYGQKLPLWTILDVLAAVALIYPAAKIGGTLYAVDFKRLPIKLTLISFICIATDSLIRIFLLIPCGLHSLFFESFDSLQGVFVEAAAWSYTEDLIVVMVSLTVGTPLLLAMFKTGFLRKEGERKR
ncbi:MAG: hypothetical protein NZ932_05490 [Candidatus Bathyarchaeota archaeon]|nr:hypothetical protein [Candidatus Bathyarchaeota archaeon]MDW8040859.1 hypothetical protein [Nitrososphaerota archaeon]